MTIEIEDKNEFLVQDIRSLVRELYDSRKVHFGPSGRSDDTEEPAEELLLDVTVWGLELVLLLLQESCDDTGDERGPGGM